MPALSSLLSELVHAVGKDAVVTDVDVMASYVMDRALGFEPEDPFVVVRPSSTAEVSAVLRAASSHGVPVVPRGAGSGLAGGANALAGCIVLSLERMNRVLHVDPVEELAVVQPGVITAEVRRAAAPFGLWYAPDPSSFEISSIGGNVATNAGGLCCVKYGVTRDSVAALEVVLADGTPIRVGSRTRKGVVGYDLVGLFVGSEGTLGVVTEITLRLRPAPHQPVTIVASLPSITAADAGLGLLRRLGPSMLEVMDCTTICAVDDALSMGLDRRAAALVFAQFDDIDRKEDELSQLDKALRGVGATEVYATMDPSEGDQLLAARRAALPALERIGPVLLDDVCVPLRHLGEAMVRIQQVAARHEVEIATFGHAGDGNLHPTIRLGPSDDEQRRAWLAFADVVELAIDLGGTASGEHGVGALKRSYARVELGGDVVALHGRIKAAFDPAGILNPGRGF